MLLNGLSIMRAPFRRSSARPPRLHSGRLLLLAALSASAPAPAQAQVAVEAATLNAQAGKGMTAVAPTPAVRLAAVDQRAGTRGTRAAAQNGPSCAGGFTDPVTVHLSAGKSTLINLPEPIVRRTQGDPQIVDSRMVSPQVLYLASGRIGSTNAILQGESGRCMLIEIVVGIDVDALRIKLAELFPAEKTVAVSSAADSLVLSGTVSNPVAAEQVVSIANAYVRSAYQQGISGEGGQGGGGGAKEKGEAGGAPLLARVVNLLAVGAPQQVMLEVKVAEISKTVLDQFGINFSRAYALADGSAIRFLSGILGGQGAVAGSISNILAEVDTATTVGNTTVRGTAVVPGVGTVGLGVNGTTANNSTTSIFTAPAGSGSTTTVPIARGKSATAVGVDALKQDGLVKILAEPTVMAISGKEGSFLAGGKIFIPVFQNNGTGIASYTLEEKEFGVSLKFRPTVLADGRINLDVSPEVSELSASGVTLTSTVTGATTVLPAFTTRKAATTVQLYDGQSFAIGGLMKNNVTGNIEAFPVLGELPVIGALFRSTSFQTDRSELVFVITPRLVKPLPADYRLPTDNYVEPTREQVILGGKLEGSAPAPTPAAPAPLPVSEPASAGPRGGGFDLE